MKNRIINTLHDSLSINLLFKFQAHFTQTTTFLLRKYCVILHIILKQTYFICGKRKLLIH